MLTMFQRVGVWILSAAALLGMSAAAWVTSDFPEESVAPAPPAGMVLIPAGWATLGTDNPDADDDQRPSRRRRLRAFYLDRLEVTQAEFRRFDPSHQYPAGEDRFPVTNVTHEQATAFAAWRGCRLPTEEEWEYAARGADGRVYPWGDDWDPSRVAPRRRKPSPKSTPSRTEPGCPPARTQPVGSRPAGVSPFGCLDMAGNAWEWVAGFDRGDRSRRVIRGGAVGYGERSCRTYYRGIEGAGVT